MTRPLTGLLLIAAMMSPGGAFADSRADFNGDGKPDIVIRNQANGANALWAMNGLAFGSIIDLVGLSNTGYRIVGTGDFNGDGSADILLRNNATGANAIWLMTGTSVNSIVDLPGLVGQWSVKAVGDFNSDGKPDIVWRGPSNYVWIMDGTAFVEAIHIPGSGCTTALNTIMEAAGDFTGDGQTDLVVRSEDSGVNEIWSMNGATPMITGCITLPILPNLDYHFVGAADYSGDGKLDLILRNSVTGQIAVWVMNGSSYVSTVDLPALPSNFDIGGPR